MTDINVLAADLVLVLHAGFVLFVVAGQLAILLGWWCGWRWARGLVWRTLHLVAIVIVVLESWCGVVCPLTTMENALRIRAGMAPYQSSFIADWIQRWLFYSAPEWTFTLAYSAFAVITVVTFVMYPPRKT